jgi:hypothetical protein
VSGHGPEQAGRLTGVQVSDSDLVEIAKRNGEFRKNYGPWLGAFLYLRSMSAARPRSFWWSGLLVTVVTGALALLQKYGWSSANS